MYVTFGGESSLGSWKGLPAQESHGRLPPPLQTGIGHVISNIEESRASGEIQLGYSRSQEPSGSLRRLRERERERERERKREREREEI